MIFGESYRVLCILLGVVVKPASEYIGEELKLWVCMFFIKFAVRVQGMGEPLNNYKAVVEGTRIMTGRCFGLSPTHITISTVRSLLHVPNSYLLSFYFLTLMLLLRFWFSKFIYFVMIYSHL